MKEERKIELEKYDISVLKKMRKLKKTKNNQLKLDGRTQAENMSRKKDLIQFGFQQRLTLKGID